MKQLKLKTIFVCLNALLLCSCAATDNEIPDQPVEQLYMQGYHYFKEKSYIIMQRIIQLY